MTNISKRDCKEILQKELKNKNFFCQEFKVEKIGEFLGFLGEYFQLRISAEVDGVSRSFSYFVKAQSIRNQQENQIQDEKVFHKKEISIYREIFEKAFDVKLGMAGDWRPEIFLSKEDVLVLEDLSVKGYKTLPFQFKFRQKHVEEALKMLARFHSCSIIYEEKNHGKKIGEQFEEVLVDEGFSVTNPWLHTSFSAVEMVAKTKTKYSKSHHQIFGESLNAKLHEMLERMYQPVDDVMKVLSHCDAWKNNLMFTFADEGFEEPTNCILLDFQIAKYLPLPIDVLIAIAANTRRSHCMEIMKDYLKFYYSRLEYELLKSGIDLKSMISFEKFIKSCEYFKHVALVYNAISIMISHIPTKVYAQMSVEEFRTFTIVSRNEVVANFMQEDSFYNECVTEAVEQLVEYLYEL